MKFPGFNLRGVFDAVLAKPGVIKLIMKSVILM